MALRRYGFWKEVQDLRVYRNPDPSKGRWMRLVLPADYANKKLCGWSQKHAKDQSANQFGCSPWGNSDFGEGDYLLYGVGFPSVSLGELKLHPLNNYDIEGDALVDSYVKGSLCNWSHDKANMKYSYEFYLDNDLEETNALEIYDDDKTVWTAGGVGTGTKSISIAEETTEKVRGTSSLKINLSTTGGAYDWLYIRRDFSLALDLTNYDFWCIWWYGANSGKNITFTVKTADSDYYYWQVVDNWSGWRRLIFPLRKPTGVSGTPSLSNITHIQIDFYPNEITDRTHYIDRTVFDFGRWVKVEARVPDSVKRVDLYSWDGSQYQKCLSGGLPSTDKLFFLDGTKLSDILPDRTGLGEAYTGSRGETKVVDNALSFDGVDDYLSIPHSDSLYFEGKNEITICLIIKVQPGASNNDSWISCNHASAPHILFGGNGSYGAIFDLYGQDNVRHRLTVSSGVDGDYHHWFATYDGRRQRIYRDGVKVAESPSDDVFTIKSPSQNIPWLIAKNKWEGKTKGLIKDVRIYNRALSASEIQQLYNRRFDKTIPDVRSGLVLDLPLDGDAQDYSGYNNHGTIYGAKFLVPTDQHQFTYSSTYGCKNRVGFIVKMPPEDFRDSASYGISQCRLKLECFYSDDGKATYEFEDSNNQYYGLRNINKKYLLLFRKDSSGPADFIQLKNTTVGDGLPTYLSVTADHNQEIHEVKLTLPNLTDQSKKHWGQSTKDPTLDEDNDGILDVVEEVEEFIDQGGWG
ncbi:MAG: LamG domain-containing protein [Nitrososphaerales archaeon]